MGKIIRRALAACVQARIVIRDVLRVARPVRTTLVILVVLIGALTLPDQAHDLFLSIRTDPGKAAYLLAATILASAAFWFSSALLAYRTTLPTDLTSVVKRHCDLLPHAIGFVAFLVPGFGFAAQVIASSTSTWRAIGDTIWGWSGLYVLLGVVMSLIFRRARRVLAWALRRVRVPVPARAGPGATRHDLASESLMAVLAHIDAAGGIVDRIGKWILLAFAGVILAMSAFWPGLLGLVGPAPVMLLAGAFWSIVFVPVVVWCDHHSRIPILTALGVLLAIAQVTDCNDNHEVRKVACAATIVRPEPRAALAGFMRASPAYTPGTPFPVFIVATEGGGIRNAYWTACVLASLEDDTRCKQALGQIPSRFSDHLFAISGVSGGSVGSVVFTALLAEELATLRENPGAPTPTFLPRVRAILGRDLLSPLLARATMIDLVQQFNPIPLPVFDHVDRARALEGALERAWLDEIGSDRLSRDFLSLGTTPPAPPGTDPRTAPVLARPARLPHLILNTTEIETGERVPVSSLRFHDRVRAFHDVLARASRPPGGCANTDLPLSTAGFLSARFPIVTPAGTVRVAEHHAETPIAGKRRYADGGYFENSGCQSAADLLELLLHRVEGQPIDRAVEDVIADARFYVIRIRYVDPDGRVPAPKRGHSFNDPLSPLRALMKTREARGKQAREHLSRIGADLPLDTGGYEVVFPVVITFDCTDLPPTECEDPVVLPLGWAISKAARRSMDAQLRAADLVRGESNMSNQAAARDIEEAMARR